jgi:tellurite resistance protein
LLSIYGSNGSFNGYASKLLDWLNLTTYSTKTYLEPLPEYEKNWELPLHLRLVLGQCALDQVPVPAHVALVWARLDPNTAFRTPAIRCAAQFESLFTQKYAEAFGAGMTLPINKTKLKFVYTPGSAGFHGYGNINLNFGDVPDVAVLTAPLKKLQDIAEAATKELESYSRYLGRNPGDAASLDGLLLLPATLWPPGVQQQFRDLQNRASRGMVALKLQDLLASFGAKGAVTKDKLVGLARALESMNLAMEPDILSGAKAPKAEETIVLFPVQPHEKASLDTPAYRAAVLTLQLANAVALADGEINPEEIRQLRTQVEGWTHLTPAHQHRLRAHMRLLMAAPVSLATLKKKLEPVEVTAKEAIAKFMAVVAQADGVVLPAEIKMLEKIYKVLGVDPKKVFSDVHAVSSSDKPAAATTHQPGPAAFQSSGFKLDMARIAALQQDTENVSALLAGIFKDEEIFPPASLTPVDEAEEQEVEHDQASVPTGLLGLDQVHASFARMLLSRPTWSREELLNVASDLDLMLDGALEQVNDASFDVHDIALTEGDDPVVVNQEILEKVPA